MAQCNSKPYFRVVFLAFLLPLVSGDCSDLDLGMESGSIPDSDIIASSTLNSSTQAKNGRLNYTAGSSWCADTGDINPYIQIDLQTLHFICAVSTQGNSQADEWVVTYILQTSTDGTAWTAYNEDAGQVKTFTGNNDRNTEEKKILYDGILTRWLRFVGKTKRGQFCMRAEVFGVKRYPVNLALKKPTVQSSTYNNEGKSENAVDGVRNIDWNRDLGLRCTHTNWENHAWWRVDLGSDHVQLSDVFIITLLTGHFGRSKNLKITLGDNRDVQSNPQCVGRYSLPGFSASAVCYNNPLRTGRYVGIMHTRAEIVALCEVEVYSRENLAYNKSTAQISDANSGVSRRAVDGNSDTTFSSGSCSHTGLANNPWWRVDLGRVEPVNQVYIVNRGDCCGDLLNSFEIRVGPASNDGGVTNPICGGDSSVSQGEGASFFCRPSLFGQYVTIRSTKSGNVALSLCEVEVYSARRACEMQAVGLASRRLFSDSSFSASSSRNGNEAFKGRLNGDGVWSPSTDGNANDYLQINLQYEFFICAVATQGNPNADHWTKKYKLLVSLNETDWVTYQQEIDTDKIFNGNGGRSDIVKHNLTNSWRARFIRFVPTDYHSRKALRVEVYGVLKPTVPFQPPDNFTVTADSSTSITARWQLPPADTKNGIIRGFKLFYKKKGFAGSEKTEVFKGTTFTKTFTNLLKYTEYEFQVWAFSSAGDGPKSALLSNRTKEDVPSQAPANFTVAAQTSTSIRASWQLPPVDSRNGIIKGFKLFYKKKGSSGSASIELIKDGSTITKTVTGLLGCTEYEFQMLAFTSAGDGTISSVEATRTKEGVPGAPRELKIDMTGKTEATLKWKEPSVRPNDVTEYIVSYTGTKTYNKTFLDIKSTIEKSTQYTATDLVPGTIYKFKVYATSTCGDSSPLISDVETEMADPPRPDVGKITTKSVSESSAVIELWPAKQRNGPISSYQVIVLKVTDGVEKLPDDYAERLNSASLDKLNFYIAAEINNVPVHVTSWKFTVGNEQPYKTYLNKKLENGQEYMVYQRAITRDNSKIFEGRVSRVAAISVEDVEGNKGTQSSSSPAAAIAVPVVIVILLIPALVVAFLFYRRRKSAEKGRKDTSVHLDDIGHHLPETTGSRDNLVYSNADEVKTTAIADKTIYQNFEKDTSETSANQIYQNADDIHTTGKAANQIYQNSKVETTSGQDNQIYQNTGGRRPGKGSARPTSQITEPVYSEAEDGKPKAVPASKFANYFKSKTINGAAVLRDEFTNLPGGMLSPWEVAKQNKAKNRYGNIVSYDHSRVVLEPTEGDPSDYINASYIPTYDEESMCYIATQGPTSVTVSDFWRMIWQENCTIIVMLTNLVEQGKAKCHQYWPDSTSKFGAITVTLQKTETFADYVIRTLVAIKNSEKREVVQFHYTTWPDRGVPHHSTALLAFRWKVHARHQLNQGPLVVHCSAGVGRTGTFIGIDAMLESAKEQGSVFIQKYLQAMRRQRPYMVQKEEQYLFLHQAVMEALVCGNTQVSTQDLMIRMTKLARVHKSSKKTGYAEEFKRLQLVSKSEDSEEESLAAFKPANIGKNRFPNIVPINGSRVLLRASESDKDYINASFVDGYTQRNTHILTQAPLDNTIEDFWRMALQYDVGTIVMLNNLEEGEESYPQYWPSAGAVTYGNVTLEILSETISKKITTRRVSVSDAKPPKKKSTVQHLQFTGWNDPNSCPDPREIISLLTAVEKSQQQTGNGIIVFQCSDGVGRSGTLSAVMSLIERIKTEQTVDVFQTIKLIRVKRPGAVVTSEQYTFCYKTILAYLDSFKTYSNFADC